MFLKWFVGSNIYHGMYRTGSEMEQSELDYWRNPMLLQLFYSFMDIFTVFSTFDIGKRLGKISQCYWKKCLNSGAPARAKRAWDRAPYSWNMVNLFSLGCHVTDRAYVRTYIRTYVRTRLQIVRVG